MFLSHKEQTTMSAQQEYLAPTPVYALSEHQKSSLKREREELQGVINAERARGRASRSVSINARSRLRDVERMIALAEQVTIGAVERIPAVQQQSQNVLQEEYAEPVPYYRAPAEQQVVRIPITAQQSTNPQQQETYADLPTPYYEGNRTQQQSTNAKPARQQFALNANAGRDAATQWATRIAKLRMRTV
jgi:hypothetical protein